MASRTAVTVGNFDGVHRGHVALVERARLLAGATGRVVALVFWPHPISRLRPAQTPEPITTLAQRERLLRGAGVDEVVRLEPTDQLLRLSPEEFIQEVVRTHAPAWFVEGPDFHFGARRAGNVHTLRQLGGRFGFRVEILEPVRVATSDQIIVTASSTFVRWLLVNGRVRDAAIVLGSPYALEGVVVPGHQRGRALGFPTANIRAETMLPRDGVYAGWASLPAGERRMAAISVGTNPTFGDERRSLEAFILDWAGPDAGGGAYSWPMELSFDAWLRDQVRYDDVAALAAQIERDVARVRGALARPQVMTARKESLA